MDTCSFCLRGKLRSSYSFAAKDPRPAPLPASWPRLCTHFICFGLRLRRSWSLHTFSCTLWSDFAVGLPSSLDMGFFFSIALCLLRQEERLFAAEVDLLALWIIEIWVDANNWLELLLWGLCGLEGLDAKWMWERVRDKHVIKFVFRPNMHFSAWEALRMAAFPLWRLHYYSYWL